MLTHLLLACLLVQEPVERLVAEAGARGQAFAMLEELCTVAPHRLAGSPGAAAAVEWARQAMLDAGLENVRLEPVMVPHWVRGSVCEVLVLDPPEAAGEKLASLALGGSPATLAAGVEAEIVELHALEEATGLDGRIAFFNRPMDASLVDSFAAYGGAVDQRGRGPGVAARAGAVATIVRSMTTRLDDVPHTGGTWFGENPQIPAAAISTLAAERLAALLARHGRVRVRLTLDCGWLEDEPSANVVGEIVGRETPEEIVLVGGHLDAWDVGQGAHDDGAGCVMSIEALRLLRALDLRPRRTIRAVMFMNEENGGRGAQGYREAHAAELSRHLFALEADRGGYAPRGITTNANDEARAILRGVADSLEPFGFGLLEQGDGGGADVDDLGPDGVVLAGYVCDPIRYFDLHHTESDTLDKVHPRELNFGAAVIAAYAWGVADAPGEWPRNAVVPTTR